jgi:hypothetical protein
LSNAAWGKTNTSVNTTNNVISPTGIAYAVQENSVSGQHSTEQTGRTISAGATVTFSVYLKNFSGTRWAMLHIIGSSGAGFVHVQPSTGTLGSPAVSGGYTNPTASVTSVGNGWYRVTLTTTTVTDTSISCSVRFKTADNSATVYTGDGYSGFYISGAQLEAGSFATSYIPTVASQVTRSADSATMTGTNFSSWYRADEGTMLADSWAIIAATNFNSPVFYITDGSENNYIRQLGSSRIASVNVNGTSQFSADFGFPVYGTQYKTAIAYQVNNFAACLNAGTVSTDTLGTIPVVDRLLIGQRISGNGVINGTIKKLAYYPKRLTNEELQGLTTV